MSRARTVMLVVAVLLIALNLRPAVVAVSPLVSQIQDDLLISSAVAGLLTAVPVLCFGILAPFTARLSRRWGVEATLFTALLVLAAGIAVRLVPGVASLFVGSVLVGSAIAIGNTLMPVVVKRDFPRHTGRMTGASTMMITGGGALAAAAMIPIERGTGLGWRPSLALWGILVVAAILLFLPWVRRSSHVRVGGTTDARLVRAVWRSPLAWQVTLFMGLQSLQFYALTAWVPTYFVDNGHAPVQAGLLLSLASVSGLVTAFLTPVLAARRPTQRHLVVALMVLFGIGDVGLLVAPTSLAPLWMVLLGLGQGVGLGLALTLIALRSPDAAHTSELSGMAQGVGYCVAAAGPLALGLLHDVTHGWTVPMLALIALLVPMAWAGWGAARNRHVGLPRPATEPEDERPVAAGLDH